MNRVSSADQMRELGSRLAGVLRTGDLVILEGPLGAGKTTLVQGLGAGLGVSGPITSPTFVIARVHSSGGPSLVHVDAYRMSSLAEIDDLGIDEDLDTAVTVVEWGKGNVEQWVENPLTVTITRASDFDEDERGISWTADRVAWEDRWQLLARILGDASD